MTVNMFRVASVSGSGKYFQNYSKAQPELWVDQAVAQQDPVLWWGKAVCASVLGLASKSPHVQSPTSGSVDWADNPFFVVFFYFKWTHFQSICALDSNLENVMQSSDLCISTSCSYKIK